MYSRVKISGHPVHPMLVGIPVTLYVVALAAYIAYGVTADRFWFRVGAWSNLAGVLAALATAVPGLIDWLAIPRGAPAKATGAAHMSFNVLALVVFAWNAALQWPARHDAVPHVGASIALAAIGVVFTAVAGSLGWKLVQTHHVGVDLTPEQERLEPRGYWPASAGTIDHGIGHGRTAH